MSTIIVRMSSSEISVLVRRVATGVPRYLGEQFPPVQAMTLSVGALVVWILCGRIAGDISFHPLAVVALATVLLLFLQLRLLDDVHTYYVTAGSGKIGGASIGGLFCAVAAATVVIAILNLAHPAMLATALASTLLMIASSFVIRLERVFDRTSRLILGRLPMFEIAPAAALGYVYIAWHTATSVSLAAGDVAAAVGIVWAGFDVWKLTRHLGDRPRERIYDIAWPLVRWLCLGLLALSLALVVVLVGQADLSTAYLAYAVAVILLFALLSRPRRAADLSRPWWAGLPFPAAMIAGVAVQLLAVL